MAWPLRARGKIIGALDVQSKEPQAFDEEDVAVLHTLADQIATALSNARLFQQLQESLNRQQRTFGELSSRAWIDTLQSQPGIGYRYTRGGIAPLTELPRSEQSAPEASVEIQQHSELEQALPELAIPLKVREYEIGTINVHKSADAGDWTPEEMAMLETMTDQLGVALESARLYQDAQRRAARERLVSDVTARMRETLDVDTVLQTAVREMRQVLGLHDVTIRLGDRESVGRSRRAAYKSDEEVRS
jgi:GAF domain-containing protein